MDKTATLELPFILPSQAQKHVTHNEALLALDALAQLVVRSRGVSVPPSNPQNGDRYLVAAGPTGAWTGRAGWIASFSDDRWRFHAVKPGFVMWLADEGRLMVHDGENLVDVSASLPESVSRVGINATADATNRLAVAAAASLFTHEGSHHRLSINKATAGDTASVLFSRNYSGRAEIGLAGSDDFSLKVSADGTTFTESFVVNAASGAVSFRTNVLAEGAVTSIMSDSGRFAGSPEPAGVTAGGFSTPPWVALANGATLTGHAKFVYNSSTYGGAGAAVDAEIQQLVALCVDPIYQQSYPEFHVAKLTAGSGTSSAVSFPDAITRYSQLYTQPFGRPVKLTTSYYIKLVSGDAGLRWANSRRLIVDGTERFASTVIETDGLWHHVLTIEDDAFPRHARFSYDSIRIYQRSGSACLIAFPAAVPGAILLPPNIGQISGAALW